MLQAKEHAPTPYLSDVFTFRFIIESTKEFGGVSHVGSAKSMDASTLMWLNGSFVNIWKTNMGFTWR